MDRSPALLCLLLTTACSWPDMREPETTTLLGAAFHHERIAIPEDATLRVRLEDRSRRGATERVVARQELALRGAQSPFAFALQFDPAEIDGGHDYVVVAEILVDEEAWFTGTSPAPVYADLPGEGLRMLLRRVGDPVVTPASPTLSGTRWVLTSVDGTPAITPEEHPTPELRFSDDTDSFLASGGVNRLSGAFDVEGDTLELRPGPTTLMAGPEPLMTQERKLFELLGEVDGFRLEGEQLELTVDGRTRLTFRANAD